MSKVEEMYEQSRRSAFSPEAMPLPTRDQLAGQDLLGLDEKKPVKVRQGFQMTTTMLGVLDGLLESGITQFNKRSDYYEAAVQRQLEWDVEGLANRQSSAVVKRHRRLRAEFGLAKEQELLVDQARLIRSRIFQELKQDEKERARELVYDVRALLADTPKGLRSQVATALIHVVRSEVSVEGPDGEEVRQMQEEPDLDDPVTAFIVEGLERLPARPDRDVEAARKRMGIR